MTNAPKKRIAVVPHTWPIGAEISFYVAGVEAVAKGNMRAFIPKGWDRAVITDAGGGKLRLYENAIRSAARAEMEQHGLRCAIEQPFEVCMIFYRTRPKSTNRMFQWPITKPDQDKLQRSVLDAMTKHVFDDDARVARVVVEKRFADAQREVGTWVRCRALSQINEGKKP